jgi:hypothetical protein
VCRTATRTLTASIAAMALTLAACEISIEADESAEEPREETTDEPDEPTEPDDPDEDVEVTALPSGMFGPECERLMNSVESADGFDDQLGQDDTQEQDPLGDNTGDGSGLDDQDGSGSMGDTEDPLNDEAATDEGDPLADGDAATAPAEDEASARLASMSLTEALATIPDLQPLAQLVQGTTATGMSEEEGPLTVFAPMEFDSETGSAAGDQTDGGLGGNELGDDPDWLVEAHVHAGLALDATQLVDSSPIETLDQEVELTITVAEDSNGPVDAGTDDGLTDDALTDEEVSGDGSSDDGLDDGTDGDLTDGDLTDGDDDRTEVPGGAEAPTLLVEGPDGDGATVVCANIETADGFLHVIEQPILTNDVDDRLGTEDAGDPFEDDEDDTGLFEDDEDDEDDGLTSS